MWDVGRSDAADATVKEVNLTVGRATPPHPLTRALMWLRFEFILPPPELEPGPGPGPYNVISKSYIASPPTAAVSWHTNISSTDRDI